MKLTVHRGSGVGHAHGKTALCLCGGGITGALFEVGVLAGFDDVMGRAASNEFDIYVGSSAGASIASFLSQGIPPERAVRALHDANDPFLPLRQEDIYQVRLAPFLKVADLLVRTFLQSVGRRDVHWAAQFATSPLPAGFFRLDRYIQFLRDFFAREGLSNHFAGLAKELYVVAHDLDSAERVVFGAGELRDVEIAMAVAASSAVPVFFEPVRIGERDFLDGGIGQVDHIDVAIAHGARRILVVNPIAPFRSGDGRLRESGFLNIGDQASRIANRTRLEFGIKRYVAEYPGVEVLLLESDAADSQLSAEGIMSLKAKTEIIDQTRAGARQAFTATYAEGIPIEQFGHWVPAEHLPHPGPRRTPAPPAEPVLTVWQMDPAHSRVGFRVGHMVVATITGRFARWSGTLALGLTGLAGGKVEVRIATASVDTHEEQRDAHLRSADFFDSAKFPEMTFCSRWIEPNATGTFDMVGELTIKGVTAEILLEVKDGGRMIDADGWERAGFTARTTIDRRDFGLGWNQRTESGGVVVGEEVEIVLEIEAKREAAPQPLSPGLSVGASHPVP